MRELSRGAKNGDRTRQVLYPLRGVGRKGEGQFERITWDEALDEIATRFLQTLIGSHERQLSAWRAGGR